MNSVKDYAVLISDISLETDTDYEFLLEEVQKLVDDGMTYQRAVYEVASKAFDGEYAK